MGEELLVQVSRISASEILCSAFQVGNDTMNFWGNIVVKHSVARRTFFRLGSSYWLDSNGGEVLEQSRARVERLSAVSERASEGVDLAFKHHYIIRSVVVSETNP